MDRIWEISRRKSWKLLAWLHGNSFLIPWDQLRGFDIWWFDMIWCLLMKQDMWSSCKNGCWTLRSDDLTHHWNWSSESLEQVCMSVELQEDWESCFCVTFWDMMLVLGVNSKHILSETKCMQHSCTLCSASKWVAKTAFQFAKMLRTCPVRHHWTLFSKSDFQLCKHHKWDRRGFLNWKRGRAWPSHIAVIRDALSWVQRWESVSGGEEFGALESQILQLLESVFLPCGSSQTDHLCKRCVLELFCLRPAFGPCT